MYGCEWILWGQSSNITHCKSPAFPLAALSALVGVVDVAFDFGADRSDGMGVSAADCATESESIASFVALAAATVVAVVVALTLATTADELVVGETGDADTSIGVSASLDAAAHGGIVFATGDNNIGAAIAVGVDGTG